MGTIDSRFEDAGRLGEALQLSTSSDNYLANVGRYMQLRVKYFGQVKILACFCIGQL